MLYEVITTHPGIKEAVLVGVPDLIYGELTCICIVRNPGYELTGEEVFEYARQNLADYAIPDRVLFFLSLPRVGTGPVRKDYLRERVRIRGKAWKFGKNIDTDAIIPARHCNTADPHEFRITSYNVCYTKLLRIVCSARASRPGQCPAVLCIL